MTDGAGSDQAFRRDLMVVAMARQIPDGALCVQGLSTPLGTAALLLAKATHAPSMTILYTDGGFIGREHHVLGLADATKRSLEASLRPIGFHELIFELVPKYRPIEFMRPAQLDRKGNSNNLRIDPGGKNLALPGPAGIPDATSVNDSLFYYLPSHSRRALVGSVDVVSGAGRQEANALPRVPVKVITELCIFSYAATGPTVESLTPGVSFDDVQERTGFDLDGTGLVETQAPSNGELEALEQIDPHRLRDLEFLPGRDRRAQMRGLLATR
jgi:glutaconate CoA-transferase, subunit B